MKSGKVHLFPCPIGGEIEYSLPLAVIEKLNETRFFIVENERSARRFLKKINKSFPIGDCTFFLIDKHFDRKNISTYFEPVRKGFDVGVLSEAGCPAIGDPGSLIVEHAHQQQIEVVPYTGPSSFLLALMASGFNGQQFAFHGYLPIKEPEKIKKLKFLEVESARLQQTQIFMETPYRNMPLFELTLKHLKGQTKLCVACALTTNEEFIKTKTISEWKKSPKPDLHKKPTVFLIYCGGI